MNSNFHQLVLSIFVLAAICFVSWLAFRSGEAGLLPALTGVVGGLVGFLTGIATNKKKGDDE